MTLDLGTLTLAKGAHGERADGVCLLEAVAWWAGEGHTDRPACVSPVLASFGRAWNDALADEPRQRLARFVPLLPGTAGDGADLARSYLAFDWLARAYAPAFFDLTPALAGHAAGLRALAPLTDSTTVKAAAPALAAARAAAWDAAGAAAGAAAWDAAGAAAWAAAWAVAGAAAWDVAWAAAGAAAGAVAGAAAWAALAPTVATLQDSALALFGAMLHPDPAPA